MLLRYGRSLSRVWMASLTLLVAIASWCFTIPAVYAASSSQAALYLSFEQRLLASYALQAQGQSSEVKNKILEQAEIYFTKVSELGVEQVKVQNFEQFLQNFRGSWPETHGLDLDLKLLAAQEPRAVREYVAESPRVQRQIERYLEWQSEQLKQMAEKESGGNSKESLKTALGQILNNNTENSQSTKELIRAAIIESSEKIISTQLQQLDQVGEKIGQASFASAKDATMRIFMQTLLSQYYSRLGEASRKQIVSAMLGEDLLASDMRKFEVMVQNSGPQLQKLLQIVAREGDLKPEFVELFKRLESSVRKVPWVLVDQLVQAEKNNYEFTYFERKPLGVGTMAQVHRAKVLHDGQEQDVVVRFIKPEIEKRVFEDAKILAEVAEILDSNPEFRKTGAPKLGPVVADVTQTVTAELKQEDTIRRQQAARQHYEKTILLKTEKYKNTLEFNVPKIFASKADSKLMVQEMVFGRKLDKETALYKELAPEMKKDIVEALSKLWAKEMMFGSGFYHSDLHQGNFLVQVTDPKITLSILDYGMGGYIPRDMQRLVMVLGVGIELLDASLISKAYWSLADKKDLKLNQQEFYQLVEQKVQNIRSGQEAPLALERWMAWVMDVGLKLPYEFISLNRGIVIINKMLKEAGSTLTLTSLLKEQAFKHPYTVYKALVLEERIPLRQLVKLGWIEVSRPYMIFPEIVPMAPVGLRCEAVFL